MVKARFDYYYIVSLDKKQMACSLSESETKEIARNRTHEGGDNLSYLQGANKSSYRSNFCDFRSIYRILDQSASATNSLYVCI